MVRGSGTAGQGEKRQRGFSCGLQMFLGRMCYVAS